MHNTEVIDRGAAGIQHRHTFDNGYGASVVKGPWTYGGPEGLWELAVLHQDAICYATDITSDVIPRLHSEEVGELLARIAALPAATDCTHEAE